MGVTRRWPPGPAAARWTASSARALLQAIALAAGLAAAAGGAPLPGRLGFEASMAVPVGDFADAMATEKSRTLRGFSLGAAHALALGDTTGFAWVTHLALLASPLARSSVRATLEDLYLPSDDVEPGSWFVVPLQSGIRHRLGEGGVFYWQMQAGADLAAIGGWPGQSPTVESSWSLGMGYALGIGLIAAERLDLGVRYWNLGVHKFTATLRDGEQVRYRGRGRTELEFFLVDLRFWL